MIVPIFLKVGDFFLLRKISIKITPINIIVNHDMMIDSFYVSWVLFVLVCYVHSAKLKDEQKALGLNAKNSVTSLY
jgi:phosphate starvation-inducible membrane PsiE